ncbi:hypothetical protein LP419_02460 [Massilia sp. H-1]|nr:hypothetical protein LP419_02460 [Massilia sp. H-1]
MPLKANAEVGVSINIGQPGFYGQIELGDFRAPPVVYAEPIIIERSPALCTRRAALPARPARPHEEVGQALRRLQRLRPPGLLRQGRLV